MNPGVEDEALQGFCNDSKSDGVIGYLRTSAKRNDNITEGINCLLEAVIKNLEGGSRESDVGYSSERSPVNIGRESSRNSGCCT